MADHSPTARILRRWVSHPAQAVLAVTAYGFFRLLPLEWASACGGRLFRVLGPRLKAHRVARRNLQRVFPEKSEREIDAITRGMWDNLGRSAAECVHIEQLARAAGPGGRIEFVGLEHVLRMRDDGKPGMIVSGHIGNWELCGLPAARSGVPLADIYRAADNPMVDRLIRWIRKPLSSELIPKGRDGARRIVQLMTQGGHIGVLVDQKMNEGLPIPFLGHDAWTATAPAALALRFRCPLIPVRVERLSGVRFRITVDPPMALPDTGDRQTDIHLLLTRMNAMLEGWIRERPEQWFWVHRRWPD